MNLNFALTLASYLNPALNNPALNSKNCKRLLSELTSDASPLSHRLFSEVKDKTRTLLQIKLGPLNYSLLTLTGRKGEFSETQKHNQQITIHTSVPWTENKRAVCENKPTNEINQSAQVAKLTEKLHQDLSRYSVY